MTLNLSMPNQPFEIKPRITVLGVGGAGGNAVNNMIKANLEGVDFVVCNTDAQALSQSTCERRIQLGVNITQGLGAGARPDIGRAAAEEALDEIIAQLQGSNMAFITAGMGGGTGTGAAPVIARAARENGILTVGVVTKPFHFEGLHRMRVAEAGIQELQQFVDTLIIIPNQNLFRVATERTTFADAFNMADEVLHSGVRGVTDLMVMPGLINLDFADIRSVMTEMGKAMMGTGEAEGENRAVAAAEAAISNPLLDDVSMKGARGVLINITGGLDMTLFEVDEAANRIRDEVDAEANIIFGSTFNPALEGKVRISVVATGIDSEANAAPRPVSLSLVAKSGRPVASPAAPVAPAAPAPQPEAAAAEPAAGAADEIWAAEAPAELPAPQPTERRPEAPVLRAEPAPRPQVAAPAKADWTPPAGAEAQSPAADAAPRSERAPAAARPLQPERTRGHGLFTRMMTGTATAWARNGVSEARDPAGAAAPERPAPVKPVAAQPVVQQPRLSLDPRERLTGSRSKDEDLLEIPAFLRRQAN